MRSTVERLRDIQEAIANIEKYTKDGHESLDENELIEVWVVRHLEIIGEAVRNLPLDFRNNYPHIPWKQISGIRDMLIHKYFLIDKEVLWEAVDQDIPVLKVAINKGLESLGENI